MYISRLEIYISRLEIQFSRGFGRVLEGDGSFSGVLKDVFILFQMQAEDIRTRYKKEGAHPICTPSFINYVSENLIRNLSVVLNPNSSVENSRYKIPIVHRHAIYESRATHQCTQSFKLATIFNYDFAKAIYRSINFRVLIA